ncbi:MAG: diadenylate cyclase [Polyangiaceae bacterium]|nr:diadenylate cyclase [Polyangiaceae bacterium]
MLHAFSSLRPADVLDILIVWGLAYVLISTLRRTRSRLVLVGVGVLAGVYLLARLLDLGLTLGVFQVLLTVAAVGLLIIFQDDLRQGFERLGAGSLFLHSKEQPDALPSVVHLLTRVAFDLAEQKTGALIVVKGKDPLDRFLSSGIPLQGKPSVELLKSIFDTSSPGHDGAVVVVDNLVERFGARLPLSGHADHAFGTRHAAALGLSEQTDALVIVVSEERGIVSVAHRGQLTPMLTDTGLKERLLPLVKAEVRPKVTVLGWFLGDFRSKALALGLTLVAWAALMTYESESALHVVTAQVAFSGVPGDWAVEEPKPREVRVTLAGSVRAFARFDRQLTLSLDATRLREGEEIFTVRPEMLTLPPGLSVNDIQPRRIVVVARQTLAVSVPVRARTSGSLPEGLVLERLRVSPPQLKIRVKKMDRGRLAYVLTEPLSLNGITGSTSRRLKVVLPIDAQPEEDAPDTVEVFADIRKIAERP